MFAFQLDALESEIVARRSSWRRQRQQEDEIINKESDISRLMGSPDSINHNEVRIYTIFLEWLKGALCP